ncbi:unnamed protein product [Mortierella alpina]
MRPTLCLFTILSSLAALGSPRKEHKGVLLHTPLHENLHPPGPKDATAVSAQNSNDLKEPCPTGCVRLGSSDVFVAVTSIGEGNPRIQYTCSSTAHPHSPTVSTADRHAKQPSHRSQQDIKPELHIHHPADPEPSPLPHDGGHRKIQGAKMSGQDSGESTIYSDLHLTDIKHHQRSFQHPQASPDTLDMDVALDEDPQHTTTLSFSDDDHPPTRPVQLTGSEEQDNKHSQRPPLMMQPIHHAGSLSPVSDSKSQGNEGIPPSPYSPQESMTAPEPIAPALITATATKTGMDSIQASPYSRIVGEEWGYGLHSDQDKVRPPVPTPEPMPAQATGSPQHLQPLDHDQQQPQQQQQQRSHDQQGSPESPRKLRTIIHRVTTLIVETETIIAPPRATPALHQHDKRYDHDHDPHPGDHIMFDAGVEGDMIVSIVSAKHASHQHRHYKDEHRKQKISQGSNKDEL